MGIKNMLRHLPHGKKCHYHHSFYDLQMKGEVVPVDAASALWQFAARHAADYLNGNHNPALTEWAHFLNYLSRICGWILIVIMDGMENVAKNPEIERRKVATELAEERGNLFGQIKNSPQYIAKAIRVCKFLGINVHVSAYEADPQVSYASLTKNLIPVSGDSDLLAYGVATKLIIVKGFMHEWYRVIDLTADVPDGEYPLFDLFKKNDNGRIVFQLYAACSGCDFTTIRSGIAGIGFATFIKVAGMIEGKLTSVNLGEALWKEHESIMRDNDFESSLGVQKYLQTIVDVYSQGKVYDNNSNTINMCDGSITQKATQLSRDHMEGTGVNSRTKEKFNNEFQTELDAMDCSQLLHQSAASSSTIRGVNLPANKPAKLCSVADLRDFIAARGGKISGKKEDLIQIVEQYQAIEAEVSKVYVDRNPNPNGLLYAKIDTGHNRSVEEMLLDIRSKAVASEDSDIRALANEAHLYYTQGLFDDKYDNISRVAPELEESFIYKTFGHIGSNIEEKNIGDALRRCWYDDETAYHGIAFVPDSHKVLIVSKAHASMMREKATAKESEEGVPGKKKEYLVIMELYYNPTDEMEDKHSLGVFVRMGRSYCGNCVAGQGLCRHRPERLWYQFHHWTEERYGIDRPSTLGICSWAPGGRKLCSDYKERIHSQQTVKYERSMEKQKEKMERDAKRDCTEGADGNYDVHYSSKKKKPSLKQYDIEARPVIDEFFREIENDTTEW